MFSITVMGNRIKKKKIYIEEQKCIKALSQEIERFINIDTLKLFSFGMAENGEKKLDFYFDPLCFQDLNKLLFSNIDWIDSKKVIELIGRISYVLGCLPRGIVGLWLNNKNKIINVEIYLRCISIANNREIYNQKKWLEYLQDEVKTFVELNNKEYGLINELLIKDKCELFLLAYDFSKNNTNKKIYLRIKDDIADQLDKYFAHTDSEKIYLLLKPMIKEKNELLGIALGYNNEGKQYYNFYFKEKFDINYQINGA